MTLVGGCQGGRTDQFSNVPPGDGGGNGNGGGTSRYVGAVYAHTNEAPNRVVAFGRNADGSLVRLGSYATGGAGTAGRLVPLLQKTVVDPLFSNDSLVLSPDRRLVFVVNAGDGTVSSFRVNADKTLTRADREATGGRLPNSLAYRNGLLYVSNVNNPKNILNMQGDARASVMGFRVDGEGNLTPIANSLRTLSTDASLPSHVIFSPSGQHLLVVELFAKTIAAYPVNGDGTLGAPAEQHNSGHLWRRLCRQHAYHRRCRPADGKGRLRQQFHAERGRLAHAPHGRRAKRQGRAVLGEHHAGQQVCLYQQPRHRHHQQLHRGRRRRAQPAQRRRRHEAGRGAVSAIDFVTSGPVDTFITPDGQYLYQQYSGRAASSPTESARTAASARSASTGAATS
jgi:sugar lactone lactonase YvrE